MLDCSVCSEGACVSKGLEGGTYCWDGDIEFTYYEGHAFSNSERCFLGNMTDVKDLAVCTVTSYGWRDDDYYGCSNTSRRMRTEVSHAIIVIVFVLVLLVGGCLFWVLQAKNSIQRLSRLLFPTTCFSVLVFGSCWGGLYAPLGAISGMFGIISGIVAYCHGFGSHSKMEDQGEGRRRDTSRGYQKECGGRTCIAHVSSLYITLAVFAALFGVATNATMCSLFFYFASDSCYHYSSNGADTMHLFAITALFCTLASFAQFTFATMAACSGCAYDSESAGLGGRGAEVMPLDLSSAPAPVVATAVVATALPLIDTDVYMDASAGAGVGASTGEYQSYQSSIEANNREILRLQQQNEDMARHEGVSMEQQRRTK
jgi:hypothetical protein